MFVLASVVVDVPQFPSAEAQRFHVIAHTPGIPYRDFAVEYPIGELVLIKTLGSSSLRVTRALLAVAACGSDAIAYATLRRRRGLVVAFRYLLLGSPLLFFLYRRFDLLGIALAVFGVTAVLRSRERSGGAALGGAVLFKLWPAVLTPALVIDRRLRAVRTTLLVVGSGFVGWMAFGGVGGLSQVAGFRGASGWELESSVGAVVWAVTGRHRFEQGANRTGFMPVWSRIVLGLLLLLLLAAVWRKARRTSADLAGAPALAAVASLLVLSTVLSPQYITWLLPWAAIASVGGRGRLWLVLAVAPIVLTGALVAAWYLNVGLGPGGNQIVLMVRNATLIAIPVAWFVLEPRGISLGRASTSASLKEGSPPGACNVAP